MANHEKSKNRVPILVRFITLAYVHICVNSSLTPNYGPNSEVSVIKQKLLMQYVLIKKKKKIPYDH